MGLTWSSPLETHLTVPGFLHSNFVSWSLVSQSIFSLLASFVPKAQPDQAVFLGWDYLLKTIFVQGPLRIVYQLNPTDFATS